jgi:hypothetical protein
MGYLPGSRRRVAVIESVMDAIVALHEAYRALDRGDHDQVRRELTQGQEFLRAANRLLGTFDRSDLAPLAAHALS